MLADKQPFASCGKLNRYSVWRFYDTTILVYFDVTATRRVGCNGGHRLNRYCSNIKAGFYQPTVTHLGDYALHAGGKMLVAFVLLMGAPLISAYFYTGTSEKSTAGGGPPPNPHV
jgi:hypothetical protein